MNSQFSVLYIFKAITQLISAIPVVLLMVALSTVLGMLLGLLFTIIRIKKIRILDSFTVGIISFLRGTPQIVQLFISYYGIPQIFSAFGVDISFLGRLFFIILTFMFNSSAMFSESFRAAYLSVDAGQREAGYSIGMTGFQCMKEVVFPQAFVVLLPNLGNQLIRLLQATSLAFTIGTVDLMGRAKIVDTWSYGVHKLEIYIAVSLIYWVICLGIEFLIKLFEKNYTKGKNSFATANS